jgi:hypothetical protein
MVDVLAAFPNTSRDEVKETLEETNPGVAKWVDKWLNNRQIAMVLDGNSGPLRDAESGLPQGASAIRPYFIYLFNLV